MVSSLCPHSGQLGEYVQPHSRRQRPGGASAMEFYPPPNESVTTSKLVFHRDLSTGAQALNR